MYRLLLLKVENSETLKRSLLKLNLLGSAIFPIVDIGHKQDSRNRRSTHSSQYLPPSMRTFTMASSSDVYRLNISPKQTVLELKR